MDIKKDLQSYIEKYLPLLITYLKKYYLLLIILFLVFSPLLMIPRRPGVGGFYVNAPGSLDSFLSLEAHGDVINEVYPLWYHVKPDGSLWDEVNPAAITFARKKKIKILPLINLVPSQDTVLLDRGARENAIANIIRIVKENQYDGVNIDFEFIPDIGRSDFSVDRPQMTLFMRVLNDELKKIRKQLHVCVFALVEVPYQITGVYDYRQLSKLVDKVTIMCYDYHRGGSPPGPLAPFLWVEQNIKIAVDQGFKPSQVCLGVATYGYDWPRGRMGGFSKPSRQILDDAVIKGYKVFWNDKYQEPYYIYTDANGVRREVWFENYATLQTKLNLVKKYHISGICIWRLGFEDRLFWRTLEKNWGKR